MSREAFEKWLENAYHGHQSQRVSKEAWWAWQAACEYQRESDAKICDDVQQQRVDGAKGEYCAGREMAAEVIRNKIRANKGE